MYLSFNARALGLRLSAAATIDLAAAAGFAGVDILIRDAIAEGERAPSLRERIDCRGLRAGAWPLPVNWRGSRDQYLADLADLPRSAEVASQAGFQRTGTWVPPEVPPEWAGTRDEFRDRVLERLETIARVLKHFGCFLGLEIIGPRTFRTGRGKPFVTCYAQIATELRGWTAATANVGLLLDAFHLHAADEAVDPVIAEWGTERIVWAHIADLPADFVGDRATILDHDRGLPGERNAVDVAGFLTQIHAGGYEGPVTVEPLAGCRSLQGLSPHEVAVRARRAAAQHWPNSNVPGR